MFSNFLSHNIYDESRKKDKKAIQNKYEIKEINNINKHEKEIKVLQMLEEYQNKKKNSMNTEINLNTQINAKDNKETKEKSIDIEKIEYMKNRLNFYENSKNIKNQESNKRLKTDYPPNERIKNEISSIKNIYQEPNENIYINENYNENRLHYIEELESETNIYNQKTEPNEITKQENFEFGAYFSSKKNENNFNNNNQLKSIEEENYEKTNNCDQYNLLKEPKIVYFKLPYEKYSNNNNINNTINENKENQHKFSNKFIKTNSSPSIKNKKNTNIVQGINSSQYLANFYKNIEKKNNDICIENQQKAEINKQTNNQNLHQFLKSRIVQHSNDLIILENEIKKETLEKNIMQNLKLQINKTDNLIPKFFSNKNNCQKNTSENKLIEFQIKKQKKIEINNSSPKNSPIQTKKLSFKYESFTKSNQINSITPSKSMSPSLQKASSESLLKSFQLRNQKMFIDENNKSKNSNNYNTINSDSNLIKDTLNICHTNNLFIQKNKNNKYEIDPMDFLYSKNVVDRNEKWLQIKNLKLKSQKNEKKENELNGCTFQPTIFTKFFKSTYSSENNTIKSNFSSQYSRFSVMKGENSKVTEKSYEKEYLKKKYFSEQKNQINMNK